MPDFESGGGTSENPKDFCEQDFLKRSRRFESPRGYLLLLIGVYLVLGEEVVFHKPSP